MNPLPYPPLALIADGFTADEQADRVLAAVKAGVRWVHLRDHSVTLDGFESAATALIDRLQAVADSVVVSVNTHVSTAEAAEVGVHLGWRGTSTAAAREVLGPEALIGYSAHEQVDARSERTQVVDYYFFSPIFPTPSKPDHPGTGIPALRDFCQATSVPVVALGGIAPGRVRECIEAGAQGVAVLSGIMKADAPVAAARAYLRALTATAE
jgi:thiamine-phosphate pyrophosphorylase